MERPEPEVAAKREEPPAHMGTLFSRAELTYDVHIAWGNTEFRLKGSALRHPVERLVLDTVFVTFGMQWAG